MDDLDDKGGWELGEPWLTPAEKLSNHPTLLAEHVLPTMMKLIRTSTGLDAQQIDRLLRLIEWSDVEPSIAKSAERWPGGDPVLPGFAVQIAAAVNYKGSTPMALRASAAAANADLDPATRDLAVSYLASTASQWEGGMFKVKPTDETPEPPDAHVGQVVADRLARCVTLAPEAAVAVADSLEGLLAGFEDDESQVLIDALTTWIVGHRTAADEASNVRAVSAHVCKHLDEIPVGIADPAMDLLLEPLRSERDPQAPDVNLARELIPTLVQHDTGHAGVVRIAGAAAAVVRQPQATDRRTAALTLETVWSCDPTITDAHSAQMLQGFQSRIASISANSTETLFSIAHVPWADANLFDALNMIDGFANDIDDVTANAAFRQLTRIPTDQPLPSGLLQRLVSGVAHDSESAAAAHAASLWGQMSEPQQRQLAFSAGHQRMQEVLLELPEADIADILMHAPDERSARTVLDNRLENGAADAAAALLRLGDDVALPVDVATHLGSRVPSTEQKSLAAELLSLLPRQESVTAAVLGAVLAIDRSLIDTDQIEQVAKQTLHEASLDTARQMGQLLSGVKLSRELNDVLKSLRKSSDEQVAEAFDAAQKGRA